MIDLPVRNGTVVDSTGVSGRDAPEELNHDLPGGCARVFSAADGIRHVVVNARVVVQDGLPTAAVPRKLERAERDATRP